MRENPPINLEQFQKLYGSEEILSSVEFSEWTGWSLRYIYQAISEYGLPYIPVGRNYFFSKGKVREWQRERDKGGESE